MNTPVNEKKTTTTDAKQFQSCSLCLHALYFLLMGCTELTLKTWSGMDQRTIHSSILGCLQGEQICSPQIHWMVKRLVTINKPRPLETALQWLQLHKWTGNQHPYPLKRNYITPKQSAQLQTPNLVHTHGICLIFLLRWKATTGKRNINGGTLSFHPRLCFEKIIFILSSKKNK